MKFEILASVGCIQSGSMELFGIERIYCGHRVYRIESEMVDSK